MTRINSTSDLDPIASSAELQRALSAALQQSAFATFKWCLAQCSADVTEAPEFHLTAPAYEIDPPDWRRFGAAPQRPLFADDHATSRMSAAASLLDQQWLDALQPQPLLAAEAALPIPLQVWQNLDVHTRRQWSARQFAKSPQHGRAPESTAQAAMGWQAADLGELAAAADTILN